MRGHTSGLAVPTFVVDLVHGGGKVPIQPNYVLDQNKEQLILKNYEGKIYHYRNPRGQTQEPVEAAAPVNASAENLFIDSELVADGVIDADRVVIRP
jgi:lysine 2,3-aminomutase